MLFRPDNRITGWVEKFQTHLTSEKVVFFDRLRLQVGQAYPNELDKTARNSADRGLVDRSIETAHNLLAFPLSHLTLT